MMSSSMNDMSATIANMMDVLNPTRKRLKNEVRTPFEHSSPLKRQLSDDSLDTPDKRARADEMNSTDISWISSPREARRIRNDLLEARTTITSLENRVDQLHQVRKELQAVFDREIQSYQYARDRDAKKIDELESVMQSIRKREQDMKEELEEVNAKINNDKVEYEEQIEQLELTVSKLESDLKYYESNENYEVSELNGHIAELQTALKAAQEDANAQKKLANELNSRMKTMTSAEREVELKKQALLEAQLKIKDMEYTLEGYGEWQQQSKIQQHRLSQFPVLERENLKLREDVKHLHEEIKNKLILEEHVHDLSTRMETMKGLETKYAQLQVSHAHLENLVEDWRSLARNISDINVSDVVLPKIIRQSIDQLQQHELVLTGEKVQLESQLKQTTNDLKLSRLELERHQKQVMDLQNTQQQTKCLIHRLQKKLTLVSGERDSYRQQLDTYEKDLTVNIVPGAAAMQHSAHNSQRERIESLEKVIEDYREMVNNLESELRKSQPNLNLDNIAPVRAEQITRMQEKIDRLQNENQKLTERYDELEIRLEQDLLKKDREVVQGQVIHLKLNPLQESVAERERNLEKLQAEIDRLKRKCRNLEEGLESSRLSESVCSSQEVQKLREQLKSSDTKMQRLKDYFKQSTNEFRNVCYMLLGYKIDRQSATSTQYTLSSMYAEAPNDCLQFQVDRDGQLNLLETPFSETLEDMVDLHLRHQSSIPVFLSAVTMDLFNRTTMAINE